MWTLIPIIYQYWVVNGNKGSLLLYCVNLSCCCCCFTLLFLWGLAASKEVVRTCLLFINYDKGTSIVDQAPGRRTHKIVHLLWHMLLLRIRHKGRGNVLLFIASFKLRPTFQQIAHIQGQTQLGTLRKMSLFFLPLDT